MRDRDDRGGSSPVDVQLVSEIPRWTVGQHSRRERASIPMCLTEDALETLLGTVGVLHPETGAKGFGPKDVAGFDVIEFDRRGSSAAMGSIYVPDVKWGDERREFHLDQPENQMRVWTGDIHSHPGWAGAPSGRAGKGLGDLGYVEEVFAMNEWMEWFFIPILTGTGYGEVAIHPWVCRRRDPLRPMIAELRICDASEFPERLYNPLWVASLEIDEEREDEAAEEVELPMAEPSEASVSHEPVTKSSREEHPEPVAAEVHGRTPRSNRLARTAVITTGIAFLCGPLFWPVAVFSAGIAVGAYTSRVVSKRRGSGPHSRRRQDVAASEGPERATMTSSTKGVPSRADKVADVASPSAPPKGNGSFKSSEVGDVDV